MNPSSSASKKDGLTRMLEEDDRVQNDEPDEDYGEEVVLPKLDLNQSTDSLGACSQLSHWDGDEDFDTMVMAYRGTQPGEEPPPDSSLSTASSLGKRKASDMSSNSSIAPPKESKHPRPEGFAVTDDNPFVSKPKEKSKESVPKDEDLNSTPLCFSPSHNLQKMFLRHKLPYGVQYEIARYVCLDKFQYADVVVPNIHKLAQFGNCSEVTPSMIMAIVNNPSSGVDDNDSEPKEVRPWQNAFAKERASKSPWAELDREEEALIDKPYGGLGFNESGEYLNWYGGKVLFHGKLQDVSLKGSRSPTFKITLEPPELGPSNMFARRFGSKHFFRLKFTKSAINTKHSQALVDYLRRPLILCGNVFRAFYTKETNAFYVKTNEVVHGDQILEGQTIDGVKSFLQFLEWHNSISLNRDQTMAKYVSRFHLGLSNSVPGIVVKQENIRFIDDIVCPETKSNMTDGAGKINRWSLLQIRHRLNWEDRPTAIQTRIFGTKGLMIDDGKCADEFAYVEVTPSQRKIKFEEGQTADLAHRIIDVLRASHVKAPCRLSVETIICLAENGVEKHVFFELLQKGLKELVEPLLEWKSQKDMMTLWCNVRRLAGVMSARRAREDVGLARVKGYSEKEAEEEQDDEIGSDSRPSEQDAVAWWRDEISGCPSSLEETIMYMLDSGFTPQECPVLRDKLHKFIKGRVAHYIKSYRIDVPMSASAFMVPDTSGKLKPGQIFFKSSRREFLAPDGSTTDLLNGYALVTRHPCKLPTDIQKMECVDIPELHYLVDVIVFSTQGKRREADLLSGGDYDGDKGIVIFQPEIVKAFTNAHLRFSEPPKNINSNFHRENMEVTTFLEKIEKLSEKEKIRVFQEYLLGSVRNMSVVGKYSTFHDIAIYTLGYRHDETIRLAYMFCLTLDGIKSGMTVLPEVLEKDTRRFQKRSPVWKETEEERARVEAHNEAHAKRPSKLGRFIMDDLYKQAREEGLCWYPKLEKSFILDGPSKLDEDLAAPWRRALEEARRWKAEENNSRKEEDLKKIQKHVESVYKDHRVEMTSPRKAGKKTPKKNGSSFTDLPTEVKQNKIRDLSLKFNSAPTTAELLMSEEEILRVRASYAYYYDFEERNGSTSRFPFDVAMRELGAIKARAVGGFKAVAGDFYDHFNIKHPNQHHH